ncbi:hypothetical protein [Streptomyces clavuligerus]|uniref:Integral membrane protein n=1 Tax=Streptomyces clavuligerus TaxID=1901 RepID=E2Q4U3_STRCL|nr:hypothetical protein [Streptomyces clavuligerus]ANW18281.1 hypothetical protein BB341_08610 [Streptomyces clavuligerus]AXU12844.1 hypothetical protein D1794_08920 [Streptomyces clavuligerus]EFG09102.1 Hypothetical protein SCLAV_4028 [Streptomyces clavuligerus]MBY6302759.1 hypothetical protein [Streptomyces clavuligerus]QCS05628.1 hypothetical protein CRV15_08350 [Streptomyces clavuligerus]
MLFAVFGSVLLGLALAWAADRRLAARLPGRPAVYGTGALGALFGAWVAGASLGPGHELGTLLGATLFGGVLLSLLLRPSAHRLRRALPF